MRGEEQSSRGDEQNRRDEQVASWTVAGAEFCKVAGGAAAGSVGGVYLATKPDDQGALALLLLFFFLFALVAVLLPKLILHSGREVREKVARRERADLVAQVADATAARVRDVQKEPPAGVGVLAGCVVGVLVGLSRRR